MFRTFCYYAVTFCAGGFIGVVFMCLLSMASKEDESMSEPPTEENYYKKYINAEAEIEKLTDENNRLRAAIVIKDRIIKGGREK